MKANIYSFHEHAVTEHLKGKIPDDRMVRIDMMELGLDPSSEKDIGEYWKYMTDAEDYELFEIEDFDMYPTEDNDNDG